MSSYLEIGRHLPELQAWKAYTVREQFKAWYPLGEDQRRQFILDGLIALDANILLDFYRMNNGARQDLLSLLQHLDNRLWVPHQAALEFHRNRFSVIYDQEDILKKLRSTVSENETKLKDAVKGLRNHPVVDRQKFETTIDAAFNDIHTYLDSVLEEPILSIEAARNGDTILESITNLLSGKVGEPYDHDRMKKVWTEAKQRMQDKRPPGYEDAKKPDGRGVGDYILWRQLLDQAGNRKIPVLLVTNDQKEDWYLRVHGITIGPRVELIEEMDQEAGVPFHAQSLPRFIEAASPLLRANIREATVSEISRLERERKTAAPPAAVFDDERRSQLYNGTGTRQATYERMATQLETIRNQTVLAIDGLEAALSDAHQGNEATADWNSDPRSYIRTLEARLEASRRDLDQINERIEYMRARQN